MSQLRVFSLNIAEVKKSTDSSEIDIHTLAPTHFGSTHTQVINQTPTLSVSNTIDETKSSYYIQDRLVAEIHILKTQDSIYDKPKSKCDRLMGKSLKKISYITLEYGNMVSYEIEYQNQKQYVIFFAGYIDGDSFYIESYWNQDEYSTKNTFYNFEIWANSLELAGILSQLTLANLSSKRAIKEVKTATLPSVFIESISYKSGLIQAKIQNNSQSKKATLIGNIHKTEDGAEKKVVQNIELSGDLVQNIDLNMGYLYDCRLKLEVDGIHDLVYIADGKWTIHNLNSPKSMLNHFIIKEAEPVVSSEDFLIERGIDLDVFVSNSYKIRRYFTPKELAIDLTDFNSIEFNAFGKGSIKIVLVDERVSLMENQLSAQFRLDEIKDLRAININNFKNYKSKEQLKNISYIDIILIGSSSNFENLTLNLSNFKFLKHTLANSSIRTDDRYSLLIHPIPASENLYIEDIDHSIESVSLYSMTGQLVYETLIHNRTTEIDIRNFPHGTYIINIRHTDNSVSSKEIQFGF